MSDMEPLWNKLNLDRPPTGSWTTLPGTFDASRFVQSINKIYDDLQSQELFKKEATILSRLIYRMKTKFRHDNGLKNMEKVNRALCNYFYLSLDEEYKKLKDSVIVDDSNTVTLPTRQMLQYVLIKTQGFSKLMCRVQDVALCAGKFFRARVITGQAWTFSMIAWATIARIWILSRNLVKKCCTWYNSMFQFVNKLKLVGVDWIPSNYCLPTNLKEWLSLPWMNEQTQCSLTSEKLSNNSMFSLIKTQDESIENEKELTVDTENISIREKNVLENKTEINPIIAHDIGVPISREAFTSSLKKSKKKKLKKMKKIDISKIKTTEDLNSLLLYDSYPGLEKLQWNIIKKTVNRKLEKLSKCQNIKKQKIQLDKIIQSIQICIN